MKIVLRIIACLLVLALLCSCREEITMQNESKTESQIASGQGVVTSAEDKAEGIKSEFVSALESAQTSNEPSAPQSEVESETLSETTSVTKTESEPVSSALTKSEVSPSTSTENKSNSSKVTTSQAKSSSKPATTSTIKSKPSSKPTTTSEAKSSKATKSPKTVKLKLSQFTYIVNDPKNTKGLSNKSNDFSFGVAENGVPHSQSVLNQKTFDAYKNVEALALDRKTKEKVMYLTFDNGYEYNNLTADILDTLKKKKVKAAFFVTLSYVKQNPKLVRRMIDEGHIVGNHSTTHPIFPDLTRTEMAEEIATLDNYLRENFSYSSPYFRFPTGAYSECSLELVTSLGFKSIFWSVAHADWDTSAQKGANNAFNTVTSRFHPGAVILLHAVSQDNADALGRIIDNARKQGYEFKTLDEYSYS